MAKYSKEEKSIFRKAERYRAKVNFYKEKIALCNDELIKIEEKKVKKNLDKALSIIEIIRIHYSLNEGYHSLLFRQHVVVDMIYKAMKLVDNNTNLSMNNLESIFNKDRSTITEALKTVDDFIFSDKKYKSEYELILKKYELKYYKYKPRKSGRKARIRIELK